MWVIVAVSLALGDTPKLRVVPGPEFQTKADCIRASRFHGNFDSDGGAVEFSVCVPKGSVEIGTRSDHDSEQRDLQQ